MTIDIKPVNPEDLVFLLHYSIGDYILNHYPEDIQVRDPDVFKLILGNIVCDYIFQN